MKTRLRRIEAKRKNSKAQVQERRSILVNDLFADDEQMTNQCKALCVDGFRQHLDHVDAEALGLAHPCVPVIGSADDVLPEPRDLGDFQTLNGAVLFAPFLSLRNQRNVENCTGGKGS